MSSPDIVVMYSGGLSSYEAARRMIEKHGRERVHLWFADTHTEDEDLYRFNKDVEKHLGVKIRVISQGVDIWGMFRKQKFLGNNRADTCSKFIKRVPLRKALIEEYPDPESVIVVIGMDNIDDCNRIKRASTHWKPYTVEYPLTEGEPPFKQRIAERLRREGIEPPRLYDLGFKHNNCGGFCIKAGLGHFAFLLETLPEVYAHHEQQEKEFREWIGKDVTILKRRKKGDWKKHEKLTLEELRLAIEGGEQFKRNWSSCMCMLPPEGKEPEWV